MLLPAWPRGRGGWRGATPTVARVEGQTSGEREGAWQSIGGGDEAGKFSAPASNHPQFAMHALLQKFGLKRGDVETLGAPAACGRIFAAEDRKSTRLNSS